MPKRVDENQRVIVTALRQFGASVWVTSDSGHGAPDIVCGYHGRSYPMEIKTWHGKLTKAERDWFDRWEGDYYIVHTFEEAIAIITNE